MVHGKRALKIRQRQTRSSGPTFNCYPRTVVNLRSRPCGTALVAASIKAQGVSDLDNRPDAVPPAIAICDPFQLWGAH